MAHRIAAGQRLPDVTLARTKRASGIDEIICIAPHSPWAVEADIEQLTCTRPGLLVGA